MTESHFEEITVGMSKEDVIFTMGIPTSRYAFMELEVGDWNKLPSPMSENVDACSNKYFYESPLALLAPKV